MFREDKGRVYKFLEEAIRGTDYASSLKPFQRSKDGRESHKAIISQYAGTDKWDVELKRCNTLLNTRKWKGNSNFTLEKFVSQHRNAFISMQQCEQHVSFQLLNGLTRVNYLLDVIQCRSTELHASMTAIQ